jgi:hypothetical protein
VVVPVEVKPLLTDTSVRVNSLQSAVGNSGKRRPSAAAERPRARALVHQQEDMGVVQLYGVVRQLGADDRVITGQKVQLERAR